MMDKAEFDKLNKIASAHDTHADFDGVLADYTGQLIAPQVKGKITLECGCSTGVITPMLLENATSLDVVEGSEYYADIVKKKYGNRLEMHVSLFEEFKPPKKYQSIVLASVLHHIPEPVRLLKQMGNWGSAGTEIHITVPNMTAFHRQLGVAMSLVKTVYDTSERNKFFDQPGRYNRDNFMAVVKEAGWDVAECSGFFFKPFPHDIMNRIELPKEVLDGLFQMGKNYPDLACQLYIRAIKK